MAGAPLTAGFWKSFVEGERDKRWTWDDDSFADSLRQAIAHAIGKSCGAVGQTTISQDRDALRALEALRGGSTPAEFDEGMGEMIVSALFARDHKATHVTDVGFQIESPAGKQNLKCRFIEKPDQVMLREVIQAWIDSHRALLAGNDISVVLTNVERWRLPSPEELHRLGRISGHRVPTAFGPTEAELAVAKFGDGDTQGCMAMFSRMLGDRETGYIRNNLAFCQLLTGDPVAGLENASKAVAGNYEPLFELNKGIGEFLLGNVDAAKASLRNSLQLLRAPGSKFDTAANYVLVLEATGKKCSAHGALPVDAAILINLWRMGASTRGELETELAKLYPENTQTWLAKFS